MTPITDDMLHDASVAGAEFAVRQFEEEAPTKSWFTVVLNFAAQGRFALKEEQKAFMEGAIATASLMGFMEPLPPVNASNYAGDWKWQNLPNKNGDTVGTAYFQNTYKM